MKYPNIASIAELFRRSTLEIVLITFVVGGFAIVFLPEDVLADIYTPVNQNRDTVELELKAMQNELLPHGTLVPAELAPPKKLRVMPVTAYNSVPAQTDATPCIGAQGTDICKIYAAGENVCAANFVPLGTRLEVEGLGTCVVRDRMNARYHYRVDWYMGMDISAARQFGVRNRAVSIYP